MLAFGDSCVSGDDKYVLAQFRADADLGWIAELRTFLELKELKYKDYQPQRHRVASNLRIKERLHRGLAQAEITIIDKPKYLRRATFMFLNAGAEVNVDFDLAALHTLAAEEMIADSPIGMIARYSFAAYDLMADNTRPSRQRFVSADLRQSAGGKLRDAIVLAARAHSMLSPSETWETIAAMHPYSPTSFAENLNRIRSMGRVFDAEHAKSLPVLNEFVGMVAQGTHIHRGLLPMLFDNRNPIEEQDSTRSDHIQAADFVAGWAADLLVSTDGDYRAIAQKVRVVVINGVVAPS